MKTSAFGTVLGLLVLALSAVSKGNDDWPTRAKSNIGAITSRLPARVLPISSSIDSFSLSISAPGVIVKREMRNGQTLTSVSMQGADLPQRDGEPSLPVIRRLIAVPECRKIRVSISVEDEARAEIGRMLPSFPEQLGRSIRNGFPGRPSRSASYSLDKVYPHTIAEVVEEGELRDQRLAILEVHPVQYDPRQGTLRLIKSLRVTLHFEGAAGPVVNNAGPMEGLLSQLALNYRVPSAPPRARTVHSGPGQVCWTTGDDWEEVASSVNSCGADYLIVVGDSLVSTPAREALVQSLADFRAAYNGFNVAIVAVSQLDASPDTSNTPVQIRSLIKSVYDNSSAAHMNDGRLGYVLLLGDAFDPQRNVIVPSSYYWGSHGSIDAAADAYYSLLSTNDPNGDPFSDVQLGRLPVDSDEDNWELSNVVNNILNYEPLPASAGWTNKILMFAGGDYGSFSFQTEMHQGFVNYFNSIDDQYIPDDQSVRKIYSGLETPPLSNEEVSEAVTDTLKNDFWVFGMFDHGNYFELAGVGFGGCFLPIHYDSLNLDAMPITFAIGSHLGEFDYTRDKAVSETCCPATVPPCPLEQTSTIDSCDVLTERLVLQPQGAIATFGYSRTTTTFHAQDDYANLFRALFQGNATTLGDILLGARLLQTDNPQTKQNLTLFGDPALNIRWTDVSHDTVDVAVSQAGIRELSGIRYLTTRGDNLIRVRLQNIGKNPATGFSFQLWMGHPDSVGSALLTTQAAPSVPGFGSVVDTVIVDGGYLEEGIVDIYVLLDSEGELDEAAITNNLNFRSFEALPYDDGYPIHLNQSAHHGVVLSDVSEEPGQEILISTLKSARCYTRGGENLWTFARGTGSQNSYKTEPLVANMFKDGKAYVVYEARGYCYVLDAQTKAVHDSILVDPTTAVPPFTYVYPYGGQSYVIHDLVGDDTSLERLFYIGNNLRAIKSDGSTLWQRRVASNPGFTGEASMAVADIDADGVQDVIAARQDTLAVFDGESGGVRWRKGYTSTSGARNVVLLDVDDDGQMEILVTTRESGAVDWLRMYDVSGNQLWQYSLGAGDADFKLAYVTAGDIDLDNEIDIVAISSAGLIILTAAGQLVASEALEEPFALGPPLLADIGGTGEVEIITMTGAANDDTYFPDLMPQYSFYIRTYDDQLDPVGTPFRVHGESAHRSLMAYPAIGDTDGDGIGELAFVSPDSVLHVIQIGSDIGAVMWSQRQRNAMSTNVVAQPLIGTYNESVSLFNTVEVVDDVALNDVTYIDGTAAVRVADSDPTPPGSPTADDKNTYTEIIVRNQFRAIGSQQQPIRFTSWDGVTESTDPWWGVFISDSTTTARGEFLHCEIRNASQGITSRRPVTLQNCLFEQCAERGVSVADADTLVVSETTIRGSDYGINALDGTTVLLSGSVIEECPSYGVAIYNNSRLDAATSSFNGNGIATYLGKESGTWSSASIRDCDYADNSHGIWVSGTGDSSVVVADCSILGSNSTGMYLESTTVIVDSTTMSGAEFGINANPGTNLTLTNSSIENESLYGMLVRVSEVDVRRTTFSGNDTGLRLNGSISWAKGLVYDCDFVGNGDGVWIDNQDSTVVIDKSTADDNTTNGVYVEGMGDVRITRSTITNNTTGIYSYGSNPQITSRNVIQYNSGGIWCDNNSVAVVESCTVNNNSGAVGAVNGANPDLGHASGGSSTGYNIFRPNTGYHVTNFTSNTIMAQVDYWPKSPPTQCSPPATKFYGPVDYSQDLGCTEPDLSAWYQQPLLSGGAEGEHVPARFRLGRNYPNPFNPTTTIPFDVPKPGSHVDVTLYDVAGRRVAVLVNERKLAGFYLITWDGTNDRGVSVASGVYFLRMRAGTFVDTKKLVLLK